MLLAGDLGGTKTNLAVYDGEELVAEATLPSGNYDSLEALVQDFLQQTGHQIEQASFGVAGPVQDGKARITNLPWQIDAEHFREALGLKSAYLLNDLESIANAIPYLPPEDLHTLNVGKVKSEGTIAVVAPGTGLGEAYLTWDGTRYRAHASEGGHVDFAPTTDRQRGLLKYLQARHAHVSYERVGSGMGLPNIYYYLRDSGYAEEPAWLAEELANASDPTPVIVNVAQDASRPVELCRATLNMFVAIIGSQTGNLALTLKAEGGIYLGGGIPLRILPYLEGETFMQAFLNKGRLSEILIDMPIHVILNTKAALLGAARYCLMS